MPHLVEFPSQGALALIYSRIQIGLVGANPSIAYINMDSENKHCDSPNIQTCVSVFSSYSETQSTVQPYNV